MQNEPTDVVVYRTVCNTDWKGRPIHILTIVGNAHNRADAVRLMDQDVSEWQAEEISDRNDCKEEGEPDDTEWSGNNGEGNVRFEIEREQPDKPRKFAEEFGDGTLSTTCYHFQHEDGTIEN